MALPNHSPKQQNECAWTWRKKGLFSAQDLHTSQEMNTCFFLKSFQLLNQLALTETSLLFCGFSASSPGFETCWYCFLFLSDSNLLFKSFYKIKLLHFTIWELSKFTSQMKPSEFWTCFNFPAKYPPSPAFFWLLATVSNKVLSRRQEILEKSNNVMTMFISFTVRPGCTSAQH